MRHTSRFWRVFVLGLLFLSTASQQRVVSAGVNLWTTHGLEGGDISALAINPEESGTLYAGTDGGGVFKSTGGGGSWSEANSGLTSLYVSALAIDPTTPATCPGPKCRSARDLRARTSFYSASHS